MAVKRLLTAGLLIIAYVASARLGLELDAVGGFATLVWAPTGIAIAALLVFGEWLWPAVAIAALLTNVLTGAPVLVAAGIGAGNAAEALVATMLLRRAKLDPKLERVRDVLALVLCAAVISPLISATAGVLSLWAGGRLVVGQLPATWQTWWTGDALGALVVLPMLLTRQAHHRQPLTRARAIELVAWWLSFATVAELGIVLAGKHPLGQPTLIYPVLIWSALRFGPRGGTTAVFVISALAIAATAHGIGPFVATSLTASLFAQQSFFASTALTVMILAAAVSERNKAILLRDDFLAVAAHELRTPLTALNLQVGMVERMVEKDEALQRDKLSERVGKIAMQIARFMALIEKLLDVSRLTDGRLVLMPEELDLVLLVREAVGRFEQSASRSGSSLELKIECERCIGKFDRMRVEQIITNLVGNSVKYGGGKPITVTLRADEKTATMTFVDGGIGIALEDQQRIFQRFERARATRDYGGLGLGLWIVKAIADAMGGAISVVSVPGDGATFTLLIPRAPPPRPAIRQG